MQFIDLKKQYSLIEPEILNRIKMVLDHGQYILGPEVEELERVLAEYVGVKHALVNSSGTDALLMALMALGVQPGDEVITSPFSFFATAEVISLCHAKPVFVDINPETYNLDENQIESAITPKTKAIMPVSLYGQCSNHGIINQIAEKYHLPVIEDAAQSFGGTYQGKNSCGISTIGCTSFFPSKPLGGYGDSGACFTDDDDLAKRIMEIRIHGQNARYSHYCVGINGRMDTIQAAILLEKMKLFPDEIQLRHQVAKRYDNLLSDFVKTPKIDKDCTSAYAQYTIEVEQRNHFQSIMQQQGIPTAVHYPVPLHLQKAMAYLGYRKGDFPIAEKASERVISLPMHPYLPTEDQHTIADAVKHALEQTKDVTF